MDVIFYDTTTASFCIDREDEDGEDRDENGKDGDGKEKALRKFAHAKEGTWSPRAVVALAVANEGIPVRCRVFPGNTSDVDTVERVRPRFAVLAARPGYVRSGFGHEFQGEQG